jgi:hypothetical protein
MVPTEAITVIDSRCGDEFTVLRPADAEHPRGSLTPSFDAVASWWTQVRSSLHRLRTEAGHSGPLQPLATFARPLADHVSVEVAIGERWWKSACPASLRFIYSVAWYSIAPFEPQMASLQTPSAPAVTA